MKAFRVATVPFALALAAGCAPMDHGTNTDGHGKNVPVATATGPSVSCIPISQISESRVRDDWTIDFRMGAGRWYRSTLPNRCNGLGFERAFTYSTSLSQLCSTDIITVISSTGGGGISPRGSCGLGQFQPVTLAK